MTGTTQPRQPGALAGQITIAPDFDDFTAQDELDWYGPSPDGHEAEPIQ